MENNKEIIDLLLEKGLIDKSLADKLLVPENELSQFYSMFLSSLIATYSASKNARDYNLPIILEEDGIIYELSPDGKKTILKILDKSLVSTIPLQFTISN